MKLSDELQLNLQQNVKAEDLGTTQERMLYWASQGWPVFPLNGKEPLVENGVKEATTDPAKIREWCSQWPNANIGGSCRGKLVVDVDVRNGARWSALGKGLDGVVTRVHWSGREDGGGHLIFQLPDTARGVKSGNSVLGEGLDIKTGTNSYVVLPGSKHPDTGKMYKTSDDAVVLASLELIQRIQDSAGVGGEGGSVKTLLSSLLKAPPAEGGRNEWLTRVCGHYAKTYRATPDLYWTHVHLANLQLKPPLEDAEVEKTGKSVWNTEASGHPERDFMESLKEESGWLISGDHQILTAGYAGDEKKSEPLPVVFADFDIKLVSTLVDPDTFENIYDVIIQRHHDHTEFAVALPGELFGDQRALKRRLAAVGVSVLQPDKLVHKNPDWTTKLNKYLIAQTAPQALRADALGWNDKEQGFLTFDGVIGSGGLRGFSLVRPNPDLKRNQAATQRYGTEADFDTAVRFLREVLTYQEDQTASVFGAWWAANWCKHLVLRHSPLFPVMGIEASSGAGKTTGFFSLMTQLAGSTMGEGHYTTPTLRNALAANFNGVVWVDDLDDPSTVHELIRVLTAGGRITKMVNQELSTSFHLVGSLILSGESLGLDAQKALLERVVVIRPPVPSGRRSQRPGVDRSQWIDVAETQRDLQAMGGGSALAGHFVTAVLGITEEIEDACLQILDEMPSGRAGNKAMALAVGARVLDYLVDPTHDLRNLREGGDHYRRVLDYLEDGSVDDLGREQSKIKGDNVLTAKLLPEYLSEHALINASTKSKVAFTDIVGEDVEIYFNANQLANWWKDKNHGQITVRTETAASLEAQVRALAQLNPDQVVRAYRKRINKGTDAPVRRFTKLSGPLAREVYERSLD